MTKRRSMKAVIQKVSSASVTVEDRIVGEIGRGYLILLGVETGDTDKDAIWLAEKIAGLRLFEDEAGKMNLDLSQVGGAVLVVSQFTLAADTKGGNRPSFTNAAPPAEGERLYDYVVAQARKLHPVVGTGSFGADMKVYLMNDGPVTIPLRIAPAVAAG